MVENLKIWGPFLASVYPVSGVNGLENRGKLTQHIKIKRFGLKNVTKTIIRLWEPFRSSRLNDNIIKLENRREEQEKEKFKVKGATDGNRHKRRQQRAQLSHTKHCIQSLWVEYGHGRPNRIIFDSCLLMSNE